MRFFECQGEAIGGDQVGGVIVGSACFDEENAGLGRGLGEAGGEGAA